MHCLECGKQLTEGVSEFSLEVYGYPLCLRHQIHITESAAAQPAIDLYFALKSKKIPVVLEYWDGHQHVDIAIPGQLYIFVNGAHHYESIQALIDLRYSVHAMKENISTMLIPEYLLSQPAMFRLTVEEIVDACRQLANPIHFPGVVLSVN
jgi:hypothetical protein